MKQTNSFRTRLVAIAMTMILAIPAVEALAFTDANFSYTVTDDTNKEVSVAGLETTVGDITIPNIVTYDGIGYKVTSIAQNGFSGNTNITSVAIPHTVKIIDQQAFLRCTALASVNFGTATGEGVEEIKLNAFQYTAIVNLEIPSTCKSIATGAFADISTLVSAKISGNTANQAFTRDTNLESIILHGNITSMDSGTFSGCSKLSSATIQEGVRAVGGLMGSKITSINIPASVESLSNNAFYNCTQLTEVTFTTRSSSQKLALGTGVFAGCSALTDITLPTVSSLNAIPASTFSNCTSLSTFTIGENITTIGNSAFSGSGLTAITLPSNITTLGVQIFKDCSNLTNIDWQCTSVTAIPNETFYNCTSLSNFTFPDNITTIGSSTFRNTAFVELDIPNSVTKIGDWSFSYCSQLQRISVPSSVTALEDCAFQQCKAMVSATIDATGTIGHSILAWNENLQTVTIGNGVLNIGHNMFHNNVSLENVTLGTGIRTISSQAFYKCTSLATITIPESVTMIETNAFQECNKLNHVDIPDAVTTLGTGVFSNCTSLTDITLGAGLTYVGPSMFANCTALSNIDIPARITEIGTNAFYNTGFITFSIPSTVITLGTGVFTNCSKLTGVNWSENVAEIPASTFSDCKAITTFNVADHITSIGNNAFYNCQSLESISFNGNLKTIGSGAFQNTGVKNVVIPGNVNTIGENAFRSCKKLTSLTIEQGVQQIGRWCFAESSALTAVTVPSSVTSLAEAVFNSCTGLKTAVIDMVGVMGNSTFAHDAALQEVTIGDYVTKLEYNQFYNNASLTTVRIGYGVTEMGTQVFYNCPSLCKLEITATEPPAVHSSTFSGVNKTVCTVGVPSVAIDAYSEAAYWSEFSNFYSLSVEAIPLVDGEEYTFPTDREKKDINYIRNFTNTEWQPLYIPFSMSYDEWSEFADVAEVHNVRGYDANGDGEIDDIVIEFNKLSSGEIIPNVPYVIKAKNTGEVTFNCTNKTLFAAPAEEGTVECSSTKMTYSFHGVYQPKTDMFSSGAYHLSGGAFRQAESDAAVLPPNRFYLKVTPKAGGYNPVLAPQKIRMVVDGEDATTFIKEIGVDTWNDDIYYDLTGRRVVNPTQGIYIQNGKKVFVK